MSNTNERDALTTIANFPITDPANMDAVNMQRIALAATAPNAVALLRQALEALEYHLEQTRPIDRTTSAISALRAYLAAPAQQAGAPLPADGSYWPVDMTMSRKQMAHQIGQMNFRLTALRQENAGLVKRNAGQGAELRRRYAAAEAPLPLAPKGWTVKEIGSDSFYLGKPGIGAGSYCKNDERPRISVVAEFLADFIAAPPQALPLAPSEAVVLDFKMATELLEMFGGEPGTVALLPGDGHSGKGLYAYYDEVPEEGAEFLGTPDSEATPPQATLPASEPDVAGISARLADLRKRIAALSSEANEPVDWSFAGWFLDTSADGDPPHWEQVAQEHANDPDVVSLGFRAQPQADAAEPAEGTVRFDIPAEECFEWFGSGYPMVKCMDCDAREYGITKIEHKAGCRVAAAIAAQAPGARGEHA